MKKMILMAALVVASVGLSNAQADKAQPVSTTSAAKPVENKNAPVMKFDKEEYNFGAIKQGDKVEYAFEFVNNGKDPLIITEAHGSCGCTVPEWPKEPLKKGEKGTIKVTFNSAGKMGMQDKTVTITSNAADSPKVLHIKGNVEQPAASPETKPTEVPKN
ncbi:MAG TPA: DUF1573 domain-containing protein [Bacteroidia bacterium]|nr:DUF1573 domain-containing protein [Bacteroidia bacterium]